MAATPTGEGLLVGGVGRRRVRVRRREVARIAGRRASPTPITALAATPTGKGYWMLAEDGGVFSFGDAHFFGRLAADGSAHGVAAELTARPQGDGYWIETNA